jgi:hypothetical protein
MQRSWIGTLIILLANLAAGPMGLAQDEAEEPLFRAVSSPYGEEVPYEIGAQFYPGVEVDGIRWSLLRVSPKRGEEISPDEDVNVVLFLDFENTINDGAEILVILLFESERGQPLHRHPCRPIRLGGEKTKSFREKFKVHGDALLATEKLYLYCEVTR